jgi:hypothetical protein
MVVRTSPRRGETCDPEAAKMRGPGIPCCRQASNHVISEVFYVRRCELMWVMAIIIETVGRPWWIAIGCRCGRDSEASAAAAADGSSSLHVGRSFIWHPGGLPTKDIGGIPGGCPTQQRPSSLATAEQSVKSCRTEGSSIG